MLRRRLTKKERIFAYYAKWASGDGGKTEFINMLQSKAYFAKTNNRRVMANGKLRTGEEIEEMIKVADDAIKS